MEEANPTSRMLHTTTNSSITTSPLQQIVGFFCNNSITMYAVQQAVTPSFSSITIRGEFASPQTFLSLPLETRFCPHLESRFCPHLESRFCPLLEFRFCPLLNRMYYTILYSSFVKSTPSPLAELGTKSFMFYFIALK